MKVIRPSEDAPLVTIVKNSLENTAPFDEFSGKFLIYSNADFPIMFQNLPIRRYKSDWNISNVQDKIFCQIGASFLRVNLR